MSEQHDGEDYCREHGHQHYSMDDMRRMHADWEAAALAARLGDSERVRALLVPTLGTWVNYGHMLTIAALGATLTVSEMFRRSGAPEGAEVALVATYMRPDLEATAVERVVVKMILAAGNKDFPALTDTLRAFCPPDNAGLDNLMDVQLELLGTYRAVTECP